MAKKKYHTEEERKAAIKASQAKYHAKYFSRPEIKDKKREKMETFWGTPKGQRSRLAASWKSQGIKFTSEFDRQIWLALALHDGTVCAVTGMTNAEHKAKFGYRLALDHDHSTGEPRRFLCRYLNTALGAVEQLALTDEQLNNLISLIKEDRR